MTVEEIHNFGIEVVLTQLEKEEYEIQSINRKYNMNPQIIAKKSNQLSFIVVRTACYPAKGLLEETVHFKMIEQANKHNAIPYFASVGIANANTLSEKEISIPVKGSGFYIAYEGLVIISRSDHVKIFDEINPGDTTEKHNLT